MEGQIMEREEYPWYMQFDQSIILNFKMPKGIVNTINELQYYYDKGDDIAYENSLGHLESRVKSCLVEGLISKEQYNLICQKYLI